MRRRDVLEGMTFGEDYIPSQFSIKELLALKAVSLVWTDSEEDISKAFDIVLDIRFPQAKDGDQ